MVSPDNVRTGKNGKQYVTLAIAWKNDDNTMTIIQKEKMAIGQKYRMFFNNYKQAGSKAPDFTISCELDKYNQETGEIMLNPVTKDVTDDIPF